MPVWESSYISCKHSTYYRHLVSGDEHTQSSSLSGLGFYLVKEVFTGEVFVPKSVPRKEIPVVIHR